MSVSTTAPISTAIDRTRHVLFTTGNAGKWFVLGFCAWLSYLGSGGGISIGNPFGGSGGPGGGPGGVTQGDFSAVESWLKEHLVLIIALVAIAVVLVLAIGLVISWVSCRGRFMFIDGIVRNRAAVVDPWREYASEGNSLFFFRLAFGILTFLGVAICMGVGALIALHDIKARDFGSGAAVGLIVGGSLLAILITTAAGVVFYTNDFVVPIMYARRQKAMAAWRELWGLFRKYPLELLLVYPIIRVLLGLVVAVLAFVGTCLTCCIAAIPYIGTVILLPLFVFSQSYPLGFIASLGPEYSGLAWAPSAASPPPFAGGGAPTGAQGAPLAPPALPPAAPG